MALLTCIARPSHGSAKQGRSRQPCSVPHWHLTLLGHIQAGQAWWVRHMLRTCDGQQPPCCHLPALRAVVCLCSRFSGPCSNPAPANEHSKWASESDPVCLKGLILSDSETQTNLTSDTCERSRCHQITYHHCKLIRRQSLDKRRQPAGSRYKYR